MLTLESGLPICGKIYGPADNGVWEKVDCAETQQLRQILHWRMAHFNTYCMHACYREWVLAKTIRYWFSQSLFVTKYKVGKKVVDTFHGK